MVWHHSISYQFNCTCVLCVTQREPGMTMKFRTLLHVCSTAVLQSTLTTVISLGSSYRELKTLQDGLLCSDVHCTAPLCTSTNWIPFWSCNKWIETTGTHKSALRLDISSHWDRDPKTEWNWFYSPWSCNIPNTELNSLCYQIYCVRRPEAVGEEIIIAGDIKLATQGVRPGLIALDTVAVGATHYCCWYLHQAQATHLKWHKYDLFKIHYSNIETRFLACSWGHGSSSVVTRNLKVKSG